MRIVDDAFDSPTLGEDVRSHVVLPDGDGPFPTAYLLHGRTGTRDDWLRVLPRLSGLPPVVLVLPDAPWSDRSSWYVDSAFTGDPPGRPVRRALLELVAHVDATYPARPARDHRVVAGVSMGAAGALELLLDHRDLFSGGIALAPATYDPQPPEGSNVRPYGAFGVGSEPFVAAAYAPHAASALVGRHDPASPVRLYLGVGTDDVLAAETARVHELADGAPGLTSRLVRRSGGHDWDVWEEAFVDGLPYVLGVEAGPEVEQ